MGLSKTHFTIENERIHLQGLRCMARLGVLDYEKVAPQEIIVNAVVYTSFEKAVYSDLIEDTLNYENIYTDIKKVCMDDHTELCECLLGKLASQLLSYPEIAKLEIRIEKTSVLANVESVGASAVFSRKSPF